MNKSERLLHAFVSVAALLLVGIFGIFWFYPTHIPNNFDGWAHVFDFLLFAIGTFVVWHPVVMEVLSWAITARIKKPAVHPTPESGKRVAFITTFVPGSEGISLLRTTLPAMVKADYPHDTWLLDEGGDPEARALCEMLGVKYFTRHGVPYYNDREGKFAAKTKGGNHNAWYDMYGDNYDYVAQIDTDFTPSRHFISRTIGYFNDPRVGFVGTPQVYGNTKESFIAKGAAEQTFGFYGPIMRGFSGMDNTLLIGANHVVRVKALRSVGHYSAHLTEDLLTGMKLHAGGWRSVYVPEALAIGEGPTTWKAFFNQQMRWAHGCMDIFLRYSPGLFKSMNIRQALYYFFLQQHYFSGLAMVLGVFGLGLYFLLGINTTDMNGTIFLALYLPVLAICGAMALWIQRFNVRPKLERGFYFAGKALAIATWPVFFMAFIGALRGKRLVFKVTPKGGAGAKHKANTVPAELFRPHLLIGVFCAVCLVAAFLFDRTSPIMLFWLFVVMLGMMLVPFSELIYNTFKTIGRGDRSRLVRERTKV